MGVAPDQLGCATWTLDNHQAIEYVSKAVDAFRSVDHGRIAYELSQVAWLLCEQLDETGESLAQAAAAAEDALNQAQRLRFPGGLAVAKRVMGLVSMYRGDVDLARAYLAEAKERFGALQRRGSLIGVLGSQADNELMSGNVKAAAEYVTEIETLRRDSGTSPDAFDFALRGRVCLGTGDVAKGMRYLQKALLANRAAGTEEGMAYALWLLGSGFLLDGQSEIATRVLAAFRATQHRLKRAFPVLDEQQSKSISPI